MKYAVFCLFDTDKRCDLTCKSLDEVEILLIPFCHTATQTGVPVQIQIVDSNGLCYRPNPSGGWMDCTGAFYIKPVKRGDNMNDFHDLVLECIRLVDPDGDPQKEKERIANRVLWAAIGVDMACDRAQQEDKVRRENAAKSRHEAEKKKFIDMLDTLKSSL